MSLTPSQRDSLVQRLADIEATLDEMSRKTFTTFTVTDASQVQMLSVLRGNLDRRQVTFRDSAADALLQNDVNGAGWGFSHPQPTTTAVGIGNYLGNGNITTTQTPNWSVFMPVLTQKIHGYGLMCIQDTNNVSRTANYTVKWAPLGTTTYTTIDTSSTSGANVAVLREWDYTWPSNMYGQLVEVSFWGACTTIGSTQCSYTPIGIVERASS